MELFHWLNHLLSFLFFIVLYCTAGIIIIKERVFVLYGYCFLYYLYFNEWFYVSNLTRRWSKVMVESCFHHMDRFMVLLRVLYLSTLQEQTHIKYFKSEKHTLLLLRGRILHMLFIFFHGRITVILSIKRFSHRDLAFCTKTRVELLKLLIRSE